MGAVNSAAPTGTGLRATGRRRCTHVLGLPGVGAKYPAAKVILTVRDRDAWLESTQALVHSFESVTFAPEARALRTACGKRCCPARLAAQSRK